MLDLLSYGFMQRALIGGVLVALLCSIVGVYLVLRRMALLGDGLAHISFGGIAAGLLFNIYPLLSALAFSIGAAIGIQKLKEMRTYSDAAIAIFFSFGLALGVTLISMTRGFATDILSYLFGNILSISMIDIFLIFGAGIITGIVLWLFSKELLFITFDEEAARVAGVPVGPLNTLFLMCVATTIVLSLRVVGILLVSSLLVIPPSIAIPRARNFHEATLLSSLIAVFSVVSGMLVSAVASIATGGAIVLILAFLYFLSLFLPRSHSLLF